MNPVQTNLFDWEIIGSAHLLAVNHPRPVYYNIWLEVLRGQYRVRKASGVKGWKPDCREWRFATRAEAEKAFNCKIKSKTNPYRQSARKYTMGDLEAENHSQRMN
ncbi:MAG: hypothetical protein JSW39_05210 [Desulfobacterales bacterium]|nr:MAG: hypothetical protein JSW39_05210 [Desulfobacterales bacterium]